MCPVLPTRWIGWTGASPAMRPGSSCGAVARRRWWGTSGMTGHSMGSIAPVTVSTPLSDETLTVAR